MPVEILKEKWNGKIGEVIIGATPDDGGTRRERIVLGGETTLPFLYFEGEMPNKVRVAMEVLDINPDWPDVVKEPFINVIESPKDWAKLCVEKYGAELICLKLMGTNPEEQNRSAEEAGETVRDVLKAVDVPLLIYGCGHAEKDAKVMEVCSEIAKGERCFLGLAEEDRYKSIAVAAQSNNHGIVAFSNLDINLAKQMNILLTDFGVKREDIIMDPLQAGLGYGLEYSYSVIERIRLAAFSGDQMLQMPILCDTTRAWNAREAVKDDDALGDVRLRAPFWEASTAISALMAGADLLIMRHPKAVEIVKSTIEQLYEGGR